MKQSLENVCRNKLEKGPGKEIDVFRELQTQCFLDADRMENSPSLLVKSVGFKAMTFTNSELYFMELNLVAINSHSFPLVSSGP